MTDLISEYISQVRILKCLQQGTPSYNKQRIILEDIWSRMSEDQRTKAIWIEANEKGIIEG